MHLQLRHSSSVSMGIFFEYQALECLSRYGMSLRRVGGTGDRGIDLRGMFTLPCKTHHKRMDFPLIIQCKFENAPLGPKYSRELLGTLGAESPGTIGMLVSHMGFSKQSLQCMHASHAPLLFSVIQNGTCTQFLVNRRAQGLLPGLVSRPGPQGVQLFLDGIMLTNGSDSGS